MSRLMNERELEELRKKYGYEPTPTRVAIDVLGVFVHKDNPIAKRGLTLAQLDAIFSSTRRGGHPGNVWTWGDLGIEGEWKDQPISLYGRNPASGAYSFFKIRALQRGDYKDNVQEQPGSSAVVAGVAKDRYGIGYSGVAYRTADVPSFRSPGTTRANRSRRFRCAPTRLTRFVATSTSTTT
jgi:phosphate transport system substrate-binding protein